MINAPVLFITFARPEYARKTFDAIKKAKPSRLYFYSDKGRESRPEEVRKNDQIRAYTHEIDWDCDLKIFFREQHSGNIDLSLWSALDWFFENEESGIVLEEDCVPSMAFFDFCDKMLPRYSKEERIWVISGNNFIEGLYHNGFDYYYTYFPFMYGWASWRSRWNKIIRGPLPYEKIKEYRLFDQVYADRKAAAKALRFTKTIINTPCWDYRFTISMKCNGGFGVVPKVNLVSNIGLSGVHNPGRKSFFHSRVLPGYDVYETDNPPPFMVPDYGYSDFWYKHYYLKDQNLFGRIKRKMKNLLRNNR